MADVYFFEPLGMLVMSHDGIARFFTETLRAADWSPQASFTLPKARVQNVGQVMSYKVPLPWLGETRGLVTIGLVAQAGLIRPVGGGYHVGWTFGFNGRGRTVDPDTGLERWALRPLGAWVTHNQDGTWSFGIGTRRSLGLGFGYDLGELPIH